MYGCYVLYQNNNKSKSLPDIYQGWHSNIWEPTWKRNKKKDSWFMSTKRLYNKVEIQIFWNSLFCPITSINGTYNTYIHDRSCSELCTGFYGKNGGAKLVLLTSILPLSATNRCYCNQYMLYHRMYNTWCGN
jgi:hypothetical protein